MVEHLPSSHEPQPVSRHSSSESHFAPQPAEHMKLLPSADGAHRPQFDLVSQSCFPSPHGPPHLEIECGAQAPSTQLPQPAREHSSSLAHFPPQPAEHTYSGLGTGVALVGTQRPQSEELLQACSPSLQGPPHLETGIGGAGGPGGAGSAVHLPSVHLVQRKVLQLSSEVHV